jgi:exopolyphosphatase/guanosine-5'-triphosphate,3'-diphosphate pyrophosphatase
MLRELSPTEDGLSVRGLRRLIKAVVAAEHVSRLTMPGLKPNVRRRLPAALAILEAVLDSLGVERMETSNGALREGVLFDLLGRIRHEDVREPTVAAMMLRYHVEKSQADRVERTALDMQETDRRRVAARGGDPRGSFCSGPRVCTRLV